VPESATVGEQLVPEQFKVKVGVYTPAAVGLNTTWPVVHVPEAASSSPEVQVPASTTKLVLSVKLKGVVPRRIGPPFAVKVIVPQLIAVPPTVIEPQASAV
jgi:hypothetical protein